MIIGDISFALDRMGKPAEVHENIALQDESYIGTEANWQLKQNIIAIFQNLSGNELTIAEKYGKNITMIMYCKYTNITAKDRILFNGNYYKITFPDNPMNINDFLQVYLSGDDLYGSQSQE